MTSSRYQTYVIVQTGELYTICRNVAGPVYEPVEDEEPLDDYDAALERLERVRRHRAGA